MRTHHRVIMWKNLGVSRLTTRYLHSVMSAEKPIIFAPETYQYHKGHLDEQDLLSDPFEQFHRWFKDAQQQLPQGSEIIPEACTFSTVRMPQGRVSSRIVLLKELDHAGFVVYSNWGTSKKAADYGTCQYASLLFFWPHLQRQVRVEGKMQPVSRETTEHYFATRPRGSKVGAWASPQSSLLTDRAQLERSNAEYEEKFKDVHDKDIPCPDHWGGMRIVPLEIEFWQGRPSRLHDRITFTRACVEDKWDTSRLAP